MFKLSIVIFINVLLNSINFYNQLFLELFLNCRCYNLKIGVPWIPVKYLFKTLYLFNFQFFDVLKKLFCRMVFEEN